MGIIRNNRVNNRKAVLGKTRNTFVYDRNTVLGIMRNICVNNRKNVLGKIRKTFVYNRKTVLGIICNTFVFNKKTVWELFGTLLRIIKNGIGNYP